MYEEHYSNKVARLVEIVRDIEENPSQLHRGNKHKDAPQALDFDWNVLVSRIDRMAEQKGIVDNPRRLCKLVLSILNNDLTNESLVRVRKLLYKVVEILEQENCNETTTRESLVQEQEKIQRPLKTSTYLTDEFWQNIVKPTCQESQSSKRVSRI